MKQVELGSDINTEKKTVEPQTATTFCCLRPKQASLLVGGFYAAYHIVLFVICLLILSNRSLHAWLTKAIYSSVDSTSGVFVDTDDEEVDGGFSWCFYFYGISNLSYTQFDYWFTLWVRSQLGLAAFVLLLSLFIIYGILARQPCCLMPFYIWGIFDVSFTVLAVLHYSSYPTVTYQFWGAVVLTVVIFLKVWWMACIWTTYGEMMRERKLSRLGSCADVEATTLTSAAHFGKAKEIEALQCE